MLITQLGLVLVFSFGLMKATEILVGALSRLSARTKLDKFGLTALLIALSTSLPELFVGLTAALEGKPSLSLGNVLGSNIANLSLVVGGAALIGGSIGVVGEFLKKDFFTAFLAGALPLLLLLDGKLSRGDGLVLVSVYVIYNLAVLWGKKAYMRKRREPIFVRAIRRLKDWDTDKEVMWIVVGSALLLFSADMLVRVGMRIAAAMGIPIFLVGLFVISIGTVLPELSFEIRAIRRREAGMVFGNLLGTIVTNAGLVLGIVSILSPIVVPDGTRAYLLATIAFVVMFGLFWLFARTKKRLDRWEGAVLLLVYLLFAWIEFSRRAF